MKILVSYRGIPQSPGWATGDMVVKALRALGEDAHSYARYYETTNWVEDPAKLRGKWDLLLFMECNDAEAPYTEFLDTSVFQFKKTATWFFDVGMTHLYAECWRNLCGYCDVNFIANKNMVGEAKNTVYMPYAADMDLHKRSLYAPKKHDVTLVGSDREERRELIAELCEAGINAQLISNVFREDYIDALAASKISICDVAGGGAGMLPMRIFEAPAAGSMLIAPAGEGLEDIIPIKNTYKGVGDLIALCDMLLSDKDLLRTNTEVGHTFVLKHHSYEQRCKEILEKVNG